MDFCEVKAQALLDRFAAANVDLVEWDQNALYRLGVDIALDLVSTPCLVMGITILSQ
jgi:hypothetical protein